MKYYKKAALVLLGMSAACVGTSAYAGVVVSNGVVTATGDHLTYTFNEVDLGLFGPLSSVSLTGNSLNFAPTGFSAASPGAGLTDWSMQITVTAHQGYRLSSFGLVEGGSFTSGGTFDATGIFGVQDNYAPNSNALSVGFSGTFSGTGWTAQTGAILPGAGWGNGGLFNDATLTIENMLVAVAGGSISKEFITISAVAVPVPEAHAYAMMLAGLGLIGFMVRRRGDASA